MLKVDDCQENFLLPPADANAEVSGIPSAESEKRRLQSKGNAIKVTQPCEFNGFYILQG